MLLAATALGASLGAPAVAQARLGDRVLRFGQRGGDVRALQGYLDAAGYQLARLPYKWGGGHGSWTDTGYDCSGSTTYAMRTTFRRGPAPTFGYDNWGLPGPGQWITVYASSYHVFMIVAGLRFDTSGLHENGSRWTSSARSMSGFRARHPAGF